MEERITTRGGTKTFAAVRVVAAATALLAMGRHPYSYYLIARCIVSPVAAYTAFAAYQQGRSGWVWTFAAVAVLFNPVFPARLDRTSWEFIDFATGMLILSSFLVLRPIAPRGLDHDRS